METADNLILLLNKLSYQIVSQEIEKERRDVRRDEKYFNNCLTRVRRRGCDVLLNKTNEPPPEDPCLTDYGGVWSPMTLIVEYGRELRDQGAVKCHEVLQASIKTLEEKQYDHLNEMLKFLLILKRPLVTSLKRNQMDFSSGTDFLSSSMDSLSFLNEEFLSGSSRLSFKKALQYEESWTKTFDPKFNVLGEYSKKNLSTQEKVSLDSLFIAAPINKNQSQSNSFVFTDFFSERSVKSEKNFFDCSSTCLGENALLDSFVDTPILHKLPSITVSQKGLSRSGMSNTSSEQIKRKLPFLPEEELLSGPRETRNQYSDGILNGMDLLNKQSVIELKRNSNFGHSFSTMHQDSSQCKTHRSSKESSDIVKKMSSPKSTSKEIILGLWEQEQNLIKEFRPDLADSFPPLRMIPLAEFVEDVKFLLTGISSRTFKYDTRKRRFTMVYGTCLEDVTPESLYHFSDEFLDIGNYYIWLNSTATEMGRSKLDICTTISQAFWKSIFDFLELHYSVILDIPPATTLMVLKSCTKDLHEMMHTLAEICKVSKPSGAFPQGGELLSYLLRVAEKVNRECVVNIIYGILQNCCNVYFRCILQTWMFKGHLEKKTCEFFVDYRRQKVKMKSRAYYNSFYIAEEKIPSFLRGCEENIFNCGKSIHFLQLFNPEDKFCQYLEKSEYPNMRLCLSDAELEKLEMEFKDYEDKVMGICGKSVSVKTIREEEKEKERCYQEYVKECKKMQQEERRLTRLKELQDLKAKKEEQNKLLNEQICFIEEEKKRRKAEEEEQNRKLEEREKLTQSKSDRLLQGEMNYLQNYYGELMGLLETRLNLVEMRKQALEKILSESGQDNSRILDIINDNATNATESTNVACVASIVSSATDGEVKENNGNAPLVSEAPTEELDINSNSNLLDTAIQEVCPVSSNGRMTSAESMGVTGNWNVVCDENSNPAVADETQGDTKTKNRIVKSLSHRTVAAEEAEKNKLKVLRSEFGLPTKKEVEPEPKEPEVDASVTDLERNRRRVLESEYDILKSPSEYISLKEVPSALGIPSENNLKPEPLHKAKSECVEELFFETVELERKEERTDFQRESSEKVDNPSIDTDSSVSFMTPPVEISSEPSLAYFCPEGQLEQDLVPSTRVLNENYQRALTRDLEMFHQKLSYEEVLLNFKKMEFNSPSCTDFMRFQRYLRRSVLIPLKTQERLANDALLKHLLVGENLLSHLNSLRGYFFLNDGEFGRSFTHSTFRSLAKCTEPQQFFERSNLSNIVNEALNYTIHNCEPNAQNLSFQIVQMPPFLNHSSHDVLSPFELSYKVDWPLNIILTEKALSKYKMVFRFLLKLKRINWTLNENFLYLNSHFKDKSLNRKMLTCSSHYHRIQIYRHAMTQVMITLDDHIFSDGIQFPWIYFLKDLETTENIDHLYQKHVRYIKDVLTRCFLSKNSEDLLDCIHNLIELTLKFHYTTKSSGMEMVRGKYVHPKFQVLKATFNEFCLVIKTFLKTLKEKISCNEILKSHYVLLEKFDLKLT